MENKFKQLAELRVNKALKALRLVKHLSNKSRYDYTKKQADLIVFALEKELKIIKDNFYKPVTEKREFKL